MWKIEVACKSSGGGMLGLLLHSGLSLSPVLLPLVLSNVLVVVGLRLVAVACLQGLLDDVVRWQLAEDETEVARSVLWLNFDHGEDGADEQVVLWELADEVSFELVEVGHVDGAVLRVDALHALVGTCVEQSLAETEDIGCLQVLGDQLTLLQLSVRLSDLLVGLGSSVGLAASKNTADHVVFRLGEVAEPLDELVVGRGVHLDELRTDVAVVQAGLVQDRSGFHGAVEHVSQFLTRESDNIGLDSSLQFLVDVVIGVLEEDSNPVLSRAEVASLACRKVYEGQEVVVVDAESVFSCYDLGGQFVFCTESFLSDHESSLVSWHFHDRDVAETAVVVLL